jgi:hypothetical protein
VAAASGLLAFICSTAPSFALNGLINVVGCSNCQTSADFAAAATAQAQSMVKVGLYVVTSTNFAETAFVRVNGTVRLQCTGSPCTIKIGAPSFLSNVTTTFVDASGNSLAGQSEASLQAAFLAIDQMLYANFRTQGKLGGPVKVPPTYGISPINNEAWDVDANTAANNVIATQTGINPASLPLGTLIMVTWHGTTAQFIRTNSVPSVLWVYLPGSMKDKNGNPITPVSGARITNPNTTGSGSGSADPSNPNPHSNTNLTGTELCKGSVTFSDGVSTVYVFITYFPC